MASHAFTSTLAELAEERGRLVTRARLLAIGFGDDEISDGIARTLLTPVLRGVYLIGGRTLDQVQLRHAATLFAAPSMVTGRAAAEHRGLLSPRSGIVTIATTRQCMNKTVKTLAPMENGRPGLVVVRPTTKLSMELIDGIPTAAVPRMLIDVAAAETASMLQRVWKQADYHGVLDLAVLDRELRATRREGTPLVKALLAKHPGRFGIPGHFESAAEVDFRQLVHDAGLPDPEINVPLHLAGSHYLADFYWRLIGLVVEVDDPSHDRPLARGYDAIRDADFVEAGLTVVRFHTDRLAVAPTRSMEQLGAIIDRLTRTQPSSSSVRGSGWPS